VIGQVFDYASTIRAFSNVTLFVVLSTFESFFMFWFDEPCSNEVAANVNEMRGEAKFDKPRKAKTDEKTPSPPSVILAIESADAGGQVALESNDPKTQSVFTGGNGKRTLNYSGKEGFDSKDLVPLLYTAILCAAKMNPQRTSDKLNITEFLNGTRFTGGALKLKESEKDYEWGHLNAVVGQPITQTVTSDPVGRVVGPHAVQ
jgi:hypothetical protein